MRHAIVTLTLLAACLAASLVSAPARADDDLETIRGRWRVTTYIVDGHDLSKSIRDDGVIYEFNPPLLTISTPRGEIPFRIALDPHAAPKQIDAEYVGTDEAMKKAYGASLPGIYELEGDILRRCLVMPTRKGPRPDNFNVAEGSNKLMVVLERIKEPRAVRPDGQ